MALIDDLRKVAASLDGSLQPTSNELGPLVGALVAYTEHGDKVVKAAEGDDGPAAVSKLLSGGDSKDDGQADDPKAQAKSDDRAKAAPK